MDQTTHTPHRDSRPVDAPSRAIDPPPVHEGAHLKIGGESYQIVAGKRRDWGTAHPAVRQILSRPRSERGAAVAWLLTAVWMVGLLVVGMYGFLRMLEQAATTR